jgi:glycosyltransferase involved in cell wall biosynthesis
LVAKLACPQNIPLVSTIHSELSKNVFEHNKLYKFAEKITTKKRFFTIAVSKVVLDDYNKLIISNQKQFVLKNYISDNYFQDKASNLSFGKFDKLRLIAVGNLKAAKNYEYLVQSMLELNDSTVTLDIFGNTKYEFFPSLQKMVEDHSLPVQFMGNQKNMSQIFSNYDLFVMSSSNEGFGIAAVEAMAAGLPVLLSDIPVLREITCNNGLFFNLSNSSSLTQFIIDIKLGIHDLNELSKNGIEIAKSYSKENHLKILFGIYDDIMLKA